MFLQTPSDSEGASRLYQKDIERRGYVMNLNRAWAWRPDVSEAFLALRTLLTSASTLSQRERAVLVCATASSLGDSYCSLAWGKMLAAAEATTFAAFRLAFSTINDALGVSPDAQVAEAAPPEVRNAVTFGRAVAA